ncbi:MAG: tetratricopeptide repeat protein [Candidatus Limnocylindrales bacterium]
MDEPAESAYDLFQRGQALLEARHHAQAAVVLERADRLEPNQASIVEALGRAYYNSRQHDLARTAFEHLLELEPNSHYGHFGMGEALRKLGERDAAVTHLRLAVAMSPDSALYRAALVRLDGVPERAGPSVAPPPPVRGPGPEDPPPAE